MSLLGKEIKLIGITQKGKNRVRENGDRWIVLASTDHILFSPSKPGPWIYVAPPGCGHLHKAARWVHGLSDLDFTVSILEN